MAFFEKTTMYVLFLIMLIPNAKYQNKILIDLNFRCYLEDLFFLEFRIIKRILLCFSFKEAFQKTPAFEGQILYEQKFFEKQMRVMNIKLKICLLFNN